ncbi:hypothetical protein HAX54_028874 [Datura stramonium]|uniref:HNH homing endonuclease n=1 Tax=Datura stramonium TaxID=4076 RepID=A0ABS8V4V6_DATST|nr:hypothetical protein [Datura stramonium]
MNSAVCSLERQPNRLLAPSACEDHIVPYATSKNLSQIKQRKYVIAKMNKLGKTVYCLVQKHLEPKPETNPRNFEGKLSLGAKILQVGELEKIFKQSLVLEMMKS